MSKKRENFYLPSRELRAITNADGSRSITGLIAYGKESVGLPWTETIAPGAFADALKPESDVLLLRDHSQAALLARTLSKTLTLEDTPAGLVFTANLSQNNSVAADTLDSISRGDLSGVSFGFQVVNDSWADDGAGVTRTLISVILYEISVTSFAAFPDSSVSLRSVPRQYRSLLDSEDEDEDDDCECDEEDDDECHCHDDEDDDEDEEDWAERSRMRLALEQVRSYSDYLRSN